MLVSRKFLVRTPLIFLRTGLALTILMIVLVSYNTILQMRTLSQVSKDMYQHPFLVSNAALELKSDIAQIRIRIMQIALSGSVSEIVPLANEIDAQSADAERQLATISQDFLGDIQRVEALKSELKSWSDYRSRIIAKSLDGTLALEEKSAITTGTFTYRKIAENIDYISSFASNRAMQFIADADLKSSNAIERLVWLTALVVLMLVGGAFYVFRTIQSYVFELQEHAHTDPLTGLLNRRQFHSMSDHEFAKLARDKRSMSVMMIDIDHFKRINDQYSHAVGDLVLVALAKTLREELRDTDLLCRWGGEEIVLLLPGISEAAAVVIANRLNNKVASSPVLAGTTEVNYTISIGISAFEDHVQVSDLINQADIALYHVKNTGRNGAATYSSVAESSAAAVQVV